jgi:hypothetical protein
LAVRQLCCKSGPDSIFDQFPEEKEGSNGPELIFRGTESVDEERKLVIRFDVRVSVSELKV